MASGKPNSTNNQLIMAETIEIELSVPVKEGHVYDEEQAQPAVPKPTGVKLTPATLDNQLCKHDFCERICLVKLRGGKLWPALRFESPSELQSVVATDLDVTPKELGRFQRKILQNTRDIPFNREVVYLLGVEKFSWSFLAMDKENMICNFYECIGRAKALYEDDKDFMKAHDIAMMRIDSTDSDDESGANGTADVLAGSTVKVKEEMIDDLYENETVNEVSSSTDLSNYNTEVESMKGSPDEHPTCKRAKCQDEHYLHVDEKVVTQSTSSAQKGETASTHAAVAGSKKVKGATRSSRKAKSATRSSRRRCPLDTRIAELIALQAEAVARSSNAQATVMSSISCGDNKQAACDDSD